MNLQEFGASASACNLVRASKTTYGKYCMPSPETWYYWNFHWFYYSCTFVWCFVRFL